MTDKDAVEILMDLIRCGRVSTWTTNEDAYRMVLEEFNLSFQKPQYE